ncbi:unnamed protein product [Rhizoctonia solani]|uniref:Transmembrane protein n=1 Tax=Rhizoctonia solani TaxID=456999 RepID=A0A8H2WYV5_9AGAM|nr:unnamed protein product [Rhizoctonia solani]
MPSFAQFAGLAIVVLSLGYFANALPTPTFFGADVLSCTGKDAYSLVFAKVIVEFQACIKAISACKDIVEVKAQIDILCSIFHQCGDKLVAIGAGVFVTAQAKTEIIACVTGIITITVRACLALVFKFGLAVCVELFAKVDIAIQYFLLKLDLCIVGIVAVIAKSIISLTVGILFELDLKLCIETLGLKFM